MALSPSLLSKFSSLFTESESDTQKATTVYGTATVVDGTVYVTLDGSEELMPVSTTVDVTTGSRVRVSISNHSAVITGSTTDTGVAQSTVRESFAKSDSEVTVSGGQITFEGNSIVILAENFRLDDEGNVTMQGKIVSSSGKIGGFTISDDCIYTGEPDDEKLNADATEYDHVVLSNTHIDLWNEGNGCETILKTGGVDISGEDFFGDELLTQLYPGGAYLPGSTYIAGQINFKSKADENYPPTVNVDAYTQSDQYTTTQEILHAWDENGDTRVGKGHYDSAKGDLSLYGVDVNIFSQSAGDSFRPYYRAGDRIVIDNCRTGGYVSSSSKTAYFTIFLSKPIIGDPKITLEDHGVVLRQQSGYTHGTAASTFVSGTYTATATDYGGIVVGYTTGSTDNATNNAPVGVQFKGTIVFS